ncbi:MAG: hypothetical protein WKF71_20805 [Pyrinomonadaceae bacterium]
MDSIWRGLFGLFVRQTGQIRGKVTNPIYDEQFFNHRTFGAAALGFVAGNRASLCRMCLAARAQGARLRGDQMMTDRQHPSTATIIFADRIVSDSNGINFARCARVFR